MPESPSQSSISQVTPPAVPDIRAERPGGLFDWALTGAIVAAALYTLYRKLWRQGGRCDGCGQAKNGSCASTTDNRGGRVKVKGP